MEDDEKFTFDQILDYTFENGVLILKTRYKDDGTGEQDLMVPFPILKRDVPLELAIFIREKVIDDQRGGFYNTWSKDTLNTHA